MTLLRSALFNAWFFLVTFLVLTTVGWVVVLLAPARAHRLARIWAGTVLAGLPLCGIRVQVDGLEYLPDEGPALLASQHQSAFDTLIWLHLAPRCSYVMKQELARIPVFGALNRASGMILVDRAGGAAALRKMLAEVSAALARGRQVVIFPEGTRVAPGQEVELQPGVVAIATRSIVPVIPVATDSGLCWGKRAFRKRAGIIHVRLLPPLPTGLSRETMLRRLRESWHEGAACPQDGG